MPVFSQTFLRSKEIAELSKVNFLYHQIIHMVHVIQTTAVST